MTTPSTSIGALVRCQNKLWNHVDAGQDQATYLLDIQDKLAKHPRGTKEYEHVVEKVRFQIGNARDILANQFMTLGALEVCFNELITSDVSPAE